MCFSMAFLSYSPVFAKKKTKDSKKASKEADTKIPKDYEKAIEAAEKGKWKDAVKSFKKAIKKNSTPGEQYYPYLYLGIAYFNTGDIEEAQEYCEQAKEIGVAPTTKIDQCLALIAQITKPAQVVEVAPTPTPEPIPTATPEPIPTLQPPTPKPQSDTPPLITITSDIPAKTGQRILTIKGTITDDHGVTHLNVSVRKPDTKAIIAVDKPQRIEEKFKVDVNLEIGPNEILIEATDTIGQVGRQAFIVHRKPPLQPGTTQERELPPPGPPGSPVGAVQRPGKVYAVIIGIGDYQDDRIPDLRYTVNDARGFYDVLTDPKYGGVKKEHVKLLVDEDATDRNIKREIGQWLRRQAREEDTVIIYYSGHGAPEDENTYWVTYNADIDDLYSTALDNNTIFDMLDRVEAKRVITFLDSCYSAATVNRTNRTRDIQVEIPWENFMGEGRITMSASNGKQLSLEMEAYEHGVFTYYLLEGLKGQADGGAREERDGVVEVEELWSYVRNQVTDTAKKQGNTQTPVLQGSLTAGIPLTYDIEYLKELERQRLEAIKEKQAKLQALFEQKKIRPDHFDCAFRMLDAGKSDGYLDGLLADEISPETFGRLFQCDAP